jgi:hypothetical protein
MAETYVGVPQIVKQLQDHFGVALRLTLMNNSGAVREVVIHNDVQQMIADIGLYNSESCLRVMDDELSQVNQENPIPPEIFHQAKLRDGLR